MGICNYIVDKKFNKVKLIDFLSFFHLGKNKMKKCDYLVNNKESSLDIVLNIGDIISIDDHENIDFIPGGGSLDILYEDEYFLIINKPSGILVHPDDKNKLGTICNMVAKYYKENNINHSVKYLHRIDIDTTGILMFAKDLLTSSYMNYLISIHEVRRVYLAITSGTLEPKDGIIDMPIGEDRHHKQRRRVSKTGERAITLYKTLKELEHNYSLIEVILETGRTHQIRVHMKYLGHPLAGDMLYGGSLKHIKRQALHSYKVEFSHPFKEETIKIEAKIPNDMKKLIGK